MIKKRVIAMIASAAMLTGMSPLIGSAETNSATDGIEPNKVPLQTWYTKPAAMSQDGWEKEATPLGNGLIGAMVFGGVAQDKIQVNEKTIWSGGPGADENFNYGIKTDSDDAKAALNELRAIFQKRASDFTKNHKAYINASGKLVTANYGYGEDAERIRELMKYSDGDRSTYGSYQTLGDMYIADPTGNNGYTDYKRSLDLRRGVMTVTYKQGETTFTREYFINYPDNMMVIRLTADKKGVLNRDISVDSVQPQKVVTGDVVNNTITMVGRPSDHGENGEIFAQQLKITQTGGSVVTIGGQSCVRDADEIVIYMTAGTNYLIRYKESDPVFNDEHPLVAVEDRIAKAVNLGFDGLLKNHLEDYQDLFNNVELNLGVTSMPNKPTNELLAEYQQMYRTGDCKNTPEENRYLEGLYYQFGRYLLIASSRAGSLPANLQGIWANGLSTPWSGDYHTNINIQMNYWLAEPTNLTECHIPMIDYINSQAFKGRDLASYYYATPEGGDVRGWAILVGCNAWNHIASNDSAIGFVPTSAAWMCQDIWEYYQFTGDKEFLKKNFKTMLDAALFWVDNLWTDERDGTLVVNPSYSPEHGGLSLGTTFDQGVVWEIFNEVIKAAEVLGIDTSEIEEIKDSQSKLSGPQIGLGGQFMEWKDETTQDVTGDGGHRHVNHLFMLHPGNQIVAGRSEQEDLYVEAMKKTLNTRGDGGSGWSKAWKVNFWARLRDGDRAHVLLNSLLGGYDLEGKGPSTAGNLLDMHAPFQIDGNFGGTAGMTEMMLQSQGEAIELLAAMPEDWGYGNVTGLKARGNVEVDMEWNHATLTKAVLRPGESQTLTVKGENLSTSSVKTADGSKVRFNTIDVNTISFDAEEGETYILSDMVDVAGLQAATAELESLIDEAQAALDSKEPTDPMYNAKANLDLLNAITEAKNALVEYEKDKFALLDQVDSLKAALETFEDSYDLTLKLTTSGGIYPSGQRIVIENANPLVEIRYTTDGTAPKADSKLYGSDLMLPYGVTTLNAAAFYNGKQVSDTVSGKYFITPTVNIGNKCAVTDESNKTIDGYPVSRIVDGDVNSRWATTQNGTLVCTVDFGKSVTFNSFLMNEFAGDDQKNRTQSYKIEYWNGSTWVEGVNSATLSADNQVVQDHQLLVAKNHAYRASVFAPITTTKVRISFNGNQISVWEVGFYQLDETGSKTFLTDYVAECKALDKTTFADTDAFDAALSETEALLKQSSVSYSDLVDAYNALNAARTAMEKTAAPESVLGDVDGDNNVAAADALLALQAATKKIALNEEQQAVADVDGQEGITANDALMILQAATKKISLDGSSSSTTTPSTPTTKPTTPPTIPPINVDKDDLVAEMNKAVEVEKYSDLSAENYLAVMETCKYVCEMDNATPLHYQMALESLKDAKTNLIDKPQENWIGWFPGMCSKFGPLSGGNILYADWSNIAQGSVDLSGYGDRSQLRLQFTATFHSSDPTIDPADVWDSFHFKLRSSDTGKENNLGWSCNSNAHKGQSVVQISIPLDKKGEHVSNVLDWSDIRRMILYCYLKSPYKDTADSAARFSIQLSMPRIVDVTPLTELQTEIKAELAKTVDTSGASAEALATYQAAKAAAQSASTASVDSVDYYDLNKALTNLQKAVENLG